MVDAGSLKLAKTATTNPIASVGSSLLSKKI
jgi:hypothetical protein